MHGTSSTGEPPRPPLPLSPAPALTATQLSLALPCLSLCALPAWACRRSLAQTEEALEAYLHLSKLTTDIRQNRITRITDYGFCDVRHMRLFSNQSVVIFCVVATQRVTPSPFPAPVAGTTTNVEIIELRASSSFFGGRIIPRRRSASWCRLATTKMPPSPRSRTGPPRTRRTMPGW